MRGGWRLPPTAVMDGDGWGPPNDREDFVIAWVKPARDAGSLPDCDRRTVTPSHRRAVEIIGSIQVDAFTIELFFNLLMDFTPCVRSLAPGLPLSPLASLKKYL